MNRFAAPDDQVKNFAPELRRTYGHSGQFLLLESARQLTIDGGAEPILAPVLEVFEPVELQTAQSDFLKPEPQQGVLPLPMPTIHAMVDGKPHPECMKNKAGEARGWIATAECAHKPGDVIVGPLLCKCMNCESSRESNARTRAKRVREGTARKGLSIGLDSFDGVPLSVSVWTVPAELRARCVGVLLSRFRSAANEMAREVFEQLGALDAPMFQRSFFHPVGEPALPTELDCQGETNNVDGVEYKPHENVLIPMAVLRYGKARRVNAFIPKDWLGADGWIGKRWREQLVGIFGQWWPESEQAPTMNLFFEYRDSPEEKAHAVKYFARPFPGWHGHDEVKMRPKALGLAHYKHKTELAELVTQLTPGGLEALKKPLCRHCGTHHKALSVRGQTEERVVYAMQRLMAERRGESLYLEQWRTMALLKDHERSIQPSQAPPMAMLSADDQFQAFPALSVR